MRCKGNASVSKYYKHRATSNGIHPICQGWRNEYDLSHNIVGQLVQYSAEMVQDYHHCKCIEDSTMQCYSCKTLNFALLNTIDMVFGLSNDK